MSIELFKHNLDAYRSALELLNAAGKAAIIHPTGTGKSFIAFKLCEDNPASDVCWISPSEYIYKTQLENLKKATDGFEPRNVKFFTYARLMNMTDSEIMEIDPDYIILDEFHRCGAQMWGEGVRKLLDKFKNAKILGLSATAIRFLDNRRDMALELFEGNIASEITLGESIVRGILKPPKYVLSLYSYQSIYDKYEKRVNTLKNKAAKDSAEEYLEALKKALEKAEGLDKVFKKHIAEPCGKYLVFCSGFEHMQKMLDKVPEWFGAVDKAPHIYSVYSDDPETSEAFKAFKNDESEHLKLLFCIDMLNEGIHVDDISGVILLRPTISPIIYKQQIGRALSASQKNNAVIFDIVLNIENLYSIGAIEEEAEVAAAYYRALGMDSEIAVDSFNVIDEVKDAFELFNKLSDLLSATWDAMYRVAEGYYLKNGNLNVPRRYITEEGYALGSWINTQRLVRAGKTNGNLTESRIEKLNAIGMIWESARDISWERHFSAAQKYFKEHGNLVVAIDTRCGDVLLGKWIAQLRCYRKSGIKSSFLTQKRVEELNAIGMVWDVPDYLWERNFSSALEYHRLHGSLDVPTGYVDKNGIRLGAWLATLRTSMRNETGRAPLTEAQILRLNELGMIWGNKNDIQWERSYEAAREYYIKHGNLDIPVAYVSENGCKLGKWIRRQREAYGKNLSEDKKNKLNAIGMVWSVYKTKSSIAV